MNTQVTGWSRFFCHPVLLSGALAALALSALPRAEAQTAITINNPSFESPTPSVFPDYTVSVTDWTLVRSDVPAGTFAPGSSGVTPAPINGTQVGYINGSGGLQQVLSTGFVPGNTYTYSVYIGTRSDATELAGTGSIELGYFDGTFHPVSSQSVSPLQGNFNFVSGTYAELGGPGVGQSIAIRLNNLGSVQVVFDSVTLTSAVPEPATAAAIGGALALALAVAWRRRAA